jgi:hypothetical protein
MEIWDHGKGFGLRAVLESNGVVSVDTAMGDQCTWGQEQKRRVKQTSLVQKENARTIMTHMPSKPTPGGYLQRVRKKFIKVTLILWEGQIIMGVHPQEKSDLHILFQ